MPHVSGHYKSKLTLMSESRCATMDACGFPKNADDADKRPANRYSLKTNAIIIWSEKYPSVRQPGTAGCREPRNAKQHV